MTKALRIGIDLDGVCYDFIESLRLWAHQSTGLPVTSFPDVDNWEFYEEWGWTEREFLNSFRDGIVAGVIFGEGPIFPDAARALARLKEDGHTIHILTDRGVPGAMDQARRNTIRWLREHSVPYDGLHIGRDKTAITVDICLEDSEYHYRELERAGSNPRLLTRPWNRSVVAAKRVDSWEEFLAEVRKLAKQSCH